MGCSSPYVYSSYETDYSTIVEYRISGSTDRASLTYVTNTGGIEQRTVNLPYSIIYHEFDYRDFHYISAQNERDNGSVTVSIYSDDRLVESATSSGAYVIATASY